MTDGNRDGIDIDALMGDVPEDPYAHLSREELIAEIERKNRDLRERGRYGLRWEMKSEDIEDRLLEVFPRLVHVPELDVDTGVAEGQPTHLLIEGDNLAALNALQATHASKVDVAVLDVPYFTGSTDFRYNDSFVAKEDAYAHSKWLSFIHRRMVLVKKLLAPTGVLFVHIDDNEFAQLKLLLDGVMGPENFLANIIWAKKRGKDNSAKHFSRSHEYVLAYAANKDMVSITRLELSEQTLSAYANPTDDPRGPYRTVAAWATGQKSGPVYAVSLGGHDFAERKWVYGKDNLLGMWEDDRLLVTGKHKDGMPNVYVKVFLAESRGSIPETIWADVSNGASGLQTLKDMFDGEIVFDTVKPVPFIQRLVEIACPKGGVVLDPYAGSGTTGQAVLELNARDGGTRRFVLVTNNENNICREVTRERLRKVMDGYATPKGKAVTGTGGRLRYLTAWPLPSFEASPEDPECIPRDAALAEVSRTGLETLAELVAIRHGAYAGTTVGGVPLLTGPGVRVAVAATGRMAGIAAGLDALGKPECGVARHLYVPCRGDELPEAVVELCGRDGIVAHAIPADVLARMRYEKAEA